MKKLLILLTVFALIETNAQESKRELTNMTKIVMTISWSTSSNEALEMVKNPQEDELLNATRRDYNDGAVIIKAESDIGSVAIYFEENTGKRGAVVSFFVYENIEDDPLVYGDKIFSDTFIDGNGTEWLRLLFDAGKTYYCTALIF